MIRALTVVLLLALTASAAIAKPEPESIEAVRARAAAENRFPRSVAVTIDDLPVVSTRSDLPTWREVTDGLLHTLKSERVPAIGFVNEQKLGFGAKPIPGRVALLRRWVDAGFELGNHTFSHPSLHSTPIEEYEADIVRGEPVTRELLAAHGETLRYFRHPFLHTGRSLETKHAVEKFLDSLGYAVAPVTIDNQEWVFARAFDNAREARDVKAMTLVRREYLAYMERMTEFWEKQSVAILGREIPQILLIHANALNADQLDELLAMFRGRGYRFITLDEALKDEAYRSEDRFTGSGGISWIHRWGLTREVPRETYRGEPEPGAEVVTLSEGN